MLLFLMSWADIKLGYRY